MQITAKTRLGFGFDFQYEEEICYRIGVVYEDGTEDEDLIGFIGNIIRLPFIEIFIGDFISYSVQEEDNKDDRNNG